MSILIQNSSTHMNTARGFDTYFVFLKKFLLYGSTTFSLIEHFIHFSFN